MVGASPVKCCSCGTQAGQVVLPGTAEERSGDGLLLLARGTELRIYCLSCAMSAGWPWLKSESTKRRGA